MNAQMPQMRQICAALFWKDWKEPFICGICRIRRTCASLRRWVPPERHSVSQGVLRSAVTSWMPVVSAQIDNESPHLFAAPYDDLRRLAERQLRRAHAAGGARAPMSANTLLHETHLEVARRDGLRFPDRARFLGYAKRATRSSGSPRTSRGWPSWSSSTSSTATASGRSRPCAPSRSAPCSGTCAGRGS